MKKTLIIMLAALTLTLGSCGNVNDTDGKIGNEKAESTTGEGAMEKASELSSDIMEGAQDIKETVEKAVDDVMNENVQAGSTPRLTADQAKLAAVADADLALKEAQFSRCYLNSGYYDIEFTSAGALYNYAIDSYTGAVLRREVSADR